MTQKNQASKSWVYTLNNYTDSDCKALEALECNRHRSCKEVGESGTPHLQGAITFTRSYRFTQLSKLFPKCHWEVAKTKDAVNYCIKGDIWLDTNNAKQGNRTDLEIGCELVCSGGLRAVAREKPTTFVKYHKGLSLLKNYLAEETEWFDTKVIVYWGDAGVGKSKAVREFCKSSGLTLYNVPEPINSSVWFDMYDDHSAILLDDFYGWIKYHTMLQWCDGYPLQLPIKGGFVQRKWTYVFITSNKPPSEWYNREEISALQRRITTVHHLVSDCVL